jgi:hypothetical protein
MGISEDINKALESEEFRAHAWDYLTELRTNWRETERDLRRSVALIIILASVFELIGRGGVAELSLASIKISELDLVRTVIPLAIAYFSNSLLLLFIEVRTYRAVHDQFFRRAYKDLGDTQLYIPLEPASSVIRTGDLTGQYLKETIFTGLAYFYLVLRFVVVILGPILFTVYSYVQLFRDQDVSRLLLWIGCGMSIFLIISGLFMVIAGFTTLDL